jgi:hypothetical protein
MPITGSATNLATAIDKFRATALAAFNAAVARVNQTPPANQDEKAAAKWDTDTAKAKAQMLSALQQIVQADSMTSDQRGRDGYGALVSIMEDARDTAKTVNAQVVTLAGSTTGTVGDRDAQLYALAAVLQALANLAPVEVWRKASGNG